FAELAPGGLLRGLALVTAPLGDLPRIDPERVAVLADEPDAALLVDGQDADGGVLEVDDAGDAGLAVGANDLGLADGDPAVLVHRPAAEGRPGAGSVGIGLGHGRVVSSQPWRTDRRAVPMSAGLLATVIPAASRAAILSDALPEPPEMIAPAWPIRLPGGAV